MNQNLYDRITIAGLDELAKAADYTHVISLINPGFSDERLDILVDHQQRLELRFHDELFPQENCTLPTPADVRRIMEFGRQAGIDRADCQARILIHCHSGISRSTASAAILLAMGSTPENHPHILSHIAKIRPIAWPNSLMLGFADTFLGPESRLQASVAELFRNRLANEPGLLARMVRLRRNPDLIALGYAPSELSELSPVKNQKPAASASR